MFIQFLTARSVNKLFIYLFISPIVTIIARGKTNILPHLILAAYRERIPSSKFSSLKMSHNIAQSSFSYIRFFFHLHAQMTPVGH